MEKKDLQEWLENPVTKYFLEYLKDSAEDEAKPIVNDILSGIIVEPMEQMRAATTCAILIRMSEIDYEEIEGFYEDR